MVMSECSKLVWDYSTGEVICIENGEVIDKIYDYGPVIRRTEAIERERVEELKRFRRYGYRADRELRRLKHRLRKRYKLLRLAKSITSRGYFVDYDKLFSMERFVFTIYSKRSVGVLEWFEKKDLRPVLDKIISVLGDREPIVFTRTIRGRYLLAYLVYEFLRGKDPGYNELDGLRIHISANTFRRLKKLARTIFIKHKPLLEKVVKDE